MLRPGLYLSLHSIRFSRFPRPPGSARVGFASQARCWREEVYYLAARPVSRTFFRNLKIRSCRRLGVLLLACALLGFEAARPCGGFVIIRKSFRM